MTQTFRQRRIRNSLFTLLAAMVVLYYYGLPPRGLHGSHFQTGYLLLGTVFCLLAFHWRKQLKVLPLGSASAWMQWHIYLGVLAIPFFLTHLRFQWPQGPLETLLATLFTATSASGVAGLYFTRTLPRRLSSTSEQFLFEQIPSFHHQLQWRTRQLVLEVAAAHGTSTLADFYLSHLAFYFEQPRSWRFRLRPNKVFRHRLLSELVSRQRYLSDAEQEACEELFRLIRQKDELDYQYALQWMLKTWIVVHLSLSYSLVFSAVVHAVLAHRFQGTG